MNESCLVISNNGVIEEKALNLIGASDKRDDDSKIGYFGSGLKYAIAYLLRNNHEITIFSGMKEMTIDTVKENFRDTDYDIIRINKQKTSFTTSMGPDWELWYAIREIYSNAIDEGNANIEITENYDPQPDNTLFVITANPDIHEFIRKFDAYFATRRNAMHTVLVGGYGEVKLYNPVDTEGASIYRKGIRCYETTMQSIYDYDIEHIEINESRVLKYGWRIYDVISELYPLCEDKYIINKLFDHINKDEYMEHAASWRSLYSFTETWLDAIDGRVLIPTEMSGWYAGKYDNPLHLPGELIISLQGFFKDRIKTPIGLKMDADKHYREIADSDMTDMHRYMWTTVKDFCEECKYKIPYDVRFVEFHEKNIMGSIDKKVVLIGLEAFRRGKFEILATLIEEVIHIESEKGDETREFQDAMIRHFINYMQNYNTILI